MFTPAIRATSPVLLSVRGGRQAAIPRKNAQAALPHTRSAPEGRVIHRGLARSISVCAVWLGHAGVQEPVSGLGSRARCPVGSPVSRRWAGLARPAAARRLTEFSRGSSGPSRRILKGRTRRTATTYVSDITFVLPGYRNLSRNFTASRQRGIAVN